MPTPDPAATSRPCLGSSASLGFWPVLALTAALTGGCATQQPAGDEAAALTQRLDRLERTLATEGGRQTADIVQQHGVLADRAGALERRTGEIDTRLGALQDALAASERRLASIEAQSGQDRRRIDELAAQTRALEANRRLDLDGLGERLAQGERQTQNLATRLEQQARQADDAATRLRALEANQRASSEALAGMAARQQQDAAGTAALAQRMTAAEERLRQLSEQVQEALALASKEIFLAMGREAFTVTLTEDRVLYPLNDPNLDPRDLVKLNDLARRLAELDQEYHLDIQGHTDNTSTDDNNYNLGKARAEVVRRHLAERKGIPVNRMSTASYGANKPLDPSGRNNRRIHIRVLVLK